MKRLFCIAAILIGTTFTAVAENYCDIIYPCRIPAGYSEGPYLAEPVIREIPYRQLQARCGMSGHGSAMGALGCAVFRGTQCQVFLPKEFRSRLPELFVLIREHELAHCRGWRHG